MSGEYEYLDTTPVEVPTRLKLPQSRTDQIRAFIRQELSMRAENQDHETFEEADDLEPDDEEYLPFTPYELNELEPPVPIKNPIAPESVRSGTEQADSGAKPAEPEKDPANGTK